MYLFCYCMGCMYEWLYKKQFRCYGHFSALRRGGMAGGGINKAAGEYVSRKAGKDKNDKSQRV